jgi:hypothetical protein
MIEVPTVSSVIDETGNVVSKVSITRKPRYPRAKYAFGGVEICNKTPVRIRGMLVDVYRNTNTARALYGVPWVIINQATKALASYAHEIHLAGVTIARKRNRIVLSGTVVSPTNESKALVRELGFRSEFITNPKPLLANTFLYRVNKEFDNNVYVLSKCEECVELIEQPIPLVRLTKDGVYA